MKKTLGKIVFSSIGALWFGLAGPLPAQTGPFIFDNSVNDLNSRFSTINYQVGDEITLAGTARHMTHFDFEYSDTGNNLTTFAGDVQAPVRFYLNDGTPVRGYTSPGTLLWDSGWILNSRELYPLVPTDEHPYRRTIDFTGADSPDGAPLFIPADSMTWTTQFRGTVPGTDDLGVDRYLLPVASGEVGDFGDYWQNDGMGWDLLTNGAAKIDFGARMYATIAEPSAAALSILGGLGVLIALRRFRRKE